MSKVTKLKVKQPDGNFSADIDLGAKAANITLEAGSDLETKLGEVDSSIVTINSAGYITKDVNNLTNYTTTENLEANYTKNTDFNGYKTTTNNRLDSVEAKVSSVYRPMGSVQSYSNLSDKQSTAQEGDVWNVIDSGKNYAWTGDEWDDLGGTVNLSNYYTKDQVYNKSEIASQIQSVVTGDLEGYLTEEEASQTYATQATVTALDGEVVKLSGNQTIKGTKTFGASPMLPVADPTNDRHAASKSYVDKAVQNATPNVGQLITTATAAQSTSSGETFGANITLHKISKTGSYNDLNNKPTIPSAPGTLITNATSAQTASSGEAMTGNITLHKVSKTGSYNDLNNKPTIPTVNNTLTSTSTSQALSANQGKVLNEKIPTVVSKLTNDAHYAKVEKADSETDALAKSKSNPDILYYWV